MNSTIAKTAPKSLVFRIPFGGVKGGRHSVPFKLALVAKTATSREAKELQEKFQRENRRLVTRRVAWHQKESGTNYGRGPLVGYLVYGIPFNEVMSSSKRKSGWEPGNSPGNSFWFGD